MKKFVRITAIGLLAGTVVACSDSNSTGNVIDDGTGVIPSTDGSTTGTTGSTDGSTTGSTDGSTTGSTDGSTTGSTDGSTDGSTTGSTSPPVNDTPTGFGNPPAIDPLAPPIPGPDANDPFGMLLEIDPEAPVAGGAPTTPKNLRIDLVSNDWAEFSWAPSNDDVEVVAYKIYRSDGHVYTVGRDQTDANAGTQAEIDKFWSTTSFIDCNYTRFSDRLHECATNGPRPGDTFSYEVSAIDNEGQESGRSNPITITYHLASNAPVPRYEDFYLGPNDRFASDHDLSNTAYFMDKFDLVFADEFNGSELDASKWTTQLVWADTRIINGEQQYFVPTQQDPNWGYDPFRFTGESLVIESIPVPANLQSKLPPVCDEPDPTGLERCQYLSGALSSHNAETGGHKFGFIYGYTEARMKVGGTPGQLSSFYLYHRYPGEGAGHHAPEIDIIEYLGENPYGDEDAFQTYHFSDVITHEIRSAPTMSYKKPEGDLYSDDFHTYGVLWEPQLVVWYIDGKEVKRMSGPMVSRQPMNIVAYLVAGSGWTLVGPDINNPNIFPLQMEIDYIRTYQRDEFKSTANFGE